MSALYTQSPDGITENNIYLESPLGSEENEQKHGKLDILSMERAINMKQIKNALKINYGACKQ